MGAYLSRVSWTRATTVEPASELSNARERASATTASWTPVRNKNRRPSPLPPSTLAEYRGRKKETIARAREEYLRKFYAMNCEDCAFVVPCVVDAIEIVDCARCVFVFGPTVGSVTVRDTFRTKIAIACAGETITLDGCRECEVYARRGVGRSGTFTAAGTSCGRCVLDDFDYDYDGLEDQMASAGFVQGAEMIERSSVTGFEENPGALASVFDAIEEGVVDAGFAFRRR